MNKLRKEILRHNKLYYTEGVPEISDASYDALIAELRELEKKHPEYLSSDTPTQTVGSPVLDRFEKIVHTAPMLSLESVNTDNEALRFDSM